MLNFAASASLRAAGRRRAALMARATSSAAAAPRRLLMLASRGHWNPPIAPRHLRTLQLLRAR